MASVSLWGYQEENEECSEPEKQQNFPPPAPSLPWEFSHPIWALQRHPLVEIQVFSSPKSSSGAQECFLLDSKGEGQFYRGKLNTENC